MDKHSVFSKTGKGLLEIKNKGNRLPKDQYRVLNLVDGKTVFADLAVQSRVPEIELRKIVTALSDGGYIKELVSPAGEAELGVGDDSAEDDLDFTKVLTDTPAQPQPRAAPVPPPPAPRTSAPTPPLPRVQAPAQPASKPTPAQALSTPPPAQPLPKPTPAQPLTKPASPQPTPSMQGAPQPAPPQPAPRPQAPSPQEQSDQRSRLEEEFTRRQAEEQQRKAQQPKPAPAPAPPAESDQADGGDLEAELEALRNQMAPSAALTTQPISRPVIDSQARHDTAEPARDLNDAFERARREAEQRAREEAVRLQQEAMERRSRAPRKPNK